MLIVILLGESCTSFAAESNFDSFDNLTQADQWYKLKLQGDEVATMIKSHGQNGGEVGAGAQLSNFEREPKDTKISSADIIAINAIIFTFLATLVQIIFNKREEMNKLALEVWSRHIDSYGEFKSIMDNLRSPSLMTQPKFVQIQKFRNWVNVVVHLSNGWMLNAGMLRSLGMDTMLKGFMTELELASLAVENSSDPDVNKFSNHFKNELVDSQAIKNWLTKSLGEGVMINEQARLFMESVRQQLMITVSDEEIDALTIEQVERAMRKAYEVVYTAPIPEDKLSGDGESKPSQEDAFSKDKPAKIMCPCGNAEITFTMKS